MIRTGTHLLLFFFLLLSGVTWVAGPVGEGVAGRLTVADVVGVLLVLWATFLSLLFRGGRISFPAEYKTLIPLLLVLLIGVVFSRRPVLGALEFLIYVYLLLVSLAIVNLVYTRQCSLNVPIILRYTLYASALLALIGLMHFFFFPGWFPGVEGGLSGTFRNTGQAGAFFGLMLALLIPAFLAKIIEPRPLPLLAISLILLALVFTFKRSAFVGFLVGVVLLSSVFLFSKRRTEKKYGVLLLVAVLLLALAIVVAGLWGVQHVEAMAWRVERKLSSEGVSEWAESFWIGNLKAAINALSDRPLIGVGLGNVQGVYSDFEIHSTYFALLATSGLLGFSGYLGFVIFWVRQIFLVPRASLYAQYLRYFSPFLIGLFVSWSYTIHLRKREFWIMVAVVSLCLHASRFGATQVNAKHHDRYLRQTPNPSRFHGSSRLRDV